MRVTKSHLSLIVKAIEEKRPVPLGDRPNKADAKGRRLATEATDWEGIASILRKEVEKFHPVYDGGADSEYSYEGADEGEYRASFWLGSQIHLSPSGKFYMPWAHGNLNACKSCGGKGRVKARSKVDKLLVAEYQRLENEDKVEWPGDLTPEWTAYIQRKNVLVIAGVNDRGVTCEQCGGNGYPEATADAAWYEQMEYMANENGLSFECVDDGYFVFKYFQVEAGATGEEEV